MSLSPATALLGDYQELDIPVVTFSPGSPTTQRRNISIVDDNAVENLEVFTVRLAADADNVQIAPLSSAVISVTDNDSK